MFHLFAVLWDLLRHHRRHWLGVVWFMLVLGVAGQVGMERLAGDLERKYATTSESQQPSLREQMRVRSIQRRQERMRRRSLHGAARGEFPAFGRAQFPVDRSPNWGAMRSPAEWTRDYSAMTAGDFVLLPSYDIDTLKTPMADLLTPYSSRNVAAITAKLFYSTRYFGVYDIDSGEYAGKHSGIDLKLALGTPVGAVGGGRVRAVRTDEHLGLMIMVEHRLPDGTTAYSVYGHLGSVAVRESQDVEAGQTLGTVGMTGKTTGPHLHFQVDKGSPGEDHAPYHPTEIPSAADIASSSWHPVRFVERFGALRTASL